MAMRGEADYTYLKENEMRARGVTRKTGTGARSRVLGRHILFEVFYSLPSQHRLSNSPSSPAHGLFSMEFGNIATTLSTIILPTSTLTE